ncbi:unnamed protein product, partial [Durusdinium trenchii]
VEWVAVGSGTRMLIRNQLCWKMSLLLTNHQQQSMLQVNLTVAAGVRVDAVCVDAE